MRYQGRITNWKDEQGYGFVTPNGGGEPVFLHLKALSGRQPRPVGDEIVTYELSTDARGRPRATAVQFVRGTGRKPPVASNAPSRWPLALVALVFALLAGATLGPAFGFMVVANRLPTPVIALYAGASLIAFVAYALDKAAARAGRWRTQENTLHLLALIGGWPGALLAQRQFRHKTAKTSFLVIFWATVLLNCGALGWLLTANGSQALRAALGAG
jgi:uncharacterized membrane protein YsdA (DUF1294 family)/cold shock CspA family protein